MTKRVVSLMGVAAVATMVILAGCSGSGSPMATPDLVAPLVGTWATAAHPAHVANPQPPPATIPVMRTVTVTIMDAEGENAGTVSIVVSDTTPVGPVVSTATATIEVTSESVLSVTISNISVVPPIIAVPPEVTALQNAPQILNYELMGEELKVSSALLMALGVTTMAEPQLTLTKQPAS